MKFDVQKKIQEGVYFHQNGNLNKAERLYRSVLKINPKNADANHNLGVLCISKNKTREALNLFNLALTANPNIEQFWISYIDSLIRDKRIDKANQLVHQAEKAGINFERANLHELAFELHQSGRYEDAIFLYYRLIIINPQIPDLYNNLALILIKLRKLEEAEVNLKKAIEIDPKNLSIKNNLSVVLKDLGKLDEAKLLLDNLIILYPNRPELHNNLGLVLHELKKFNDAKKSFENAIKIKTNFTSSYNNLGITLLKIKDYKASELNFRKAIALEPSFFESYNNLANLLIKFGKLEDAVQNYKKALSINPKYYDSALNLASTLHNLNENDQAINIFEKIKNIKDKDIGFRAEVALSILKFLKGDLVNCKNILKTSLNNIDSLSKNSKNEQIYHQYLSKILKWHHTKLSDNSINRNNKLLYVVGDSHSLASHLLKIDFLGNKFICNAKLIMGCKQWHLGNLQNNQYKRKFELIINYLPKYSYVLLSIGEIDCRIDEGIIQYAKKNKTSDIKKIIKKTIHDYFNYIVLNNLKNKHKIIIQGVPCPNLDLNIYTQDDIRKLTMVVDQFNKELIKQSKEKKFKFLDLHKLTNRGDGYSNKIWHLEDIHLSPSAMQEAWNNYI